MASFCFNPACHKVFSYHTSQLLGPVTVSHSASFSWLWCPWRELARYPAEWPLILVCLIFFSWLDGVMGFWKENCEEVPFSSHHVHMTALGMLIFITWLRQCLPGFSSAKVFFPFSTFGWWSLSVAYPQG